MRLLAIGTIVFLVACVGLLLAALPGRPDCTASAEAGYIRGKEAGEIQGARRVLKALTELERGENGKVDKTKETKPLPYR